MKYWEDIQDKKQVGIVINNIGIIHMNQEDYTTALSYLYQSLELMQTLDNQPRIASTCINLGISLRELSDYNKSRFFYKKSLNI